MGMAVGSAADEQPRWSLFTELHALIDQGDHRFEPLPTSPFDAAATLHRIEAESQQTMWNMQRSMTLGSLREGDEMTRRAWRRGIRMRLMVPSYVVDHRCPLLSSYDPGVRIAAVPHPMIVWDRRRVLVGNSTGETMWTTSDPELVARAVDLYAQAWRTARPAVPDGTEPAFTDRMVQIAFRLVDGETDREIARGLGVSERTVSSDVREMCTRLGARGRAQAIALASGVAG